jgi:uncharacterized protein YigE (DUF2233 family)
LTLAKDAEILPAPSGSQLMRGRREMRLAMRVGVLSLVFALASRSAVAIDCSHVAAGNTSLTVCRADVRRDALHVFLNDAKGQPLRTFAALERAIAAQGKRLAFAMNIAVVEPSASP